jgi:hypothetical protein
MRIVRFSKQSLEFGQKTHYWKECRSAFIPRRRQSRIVSSIETRSGSMLHSRLSANLPGAEKRPPPTSGKPPKVSLRIGGQPSDVLLRGWGARLDRGTAAGQRTGTARYASGQHSGFSASRRGYKSGRWNDLNQVTDEMRLAMGPSAAGTGGEPVGVERQANRILPWPRRASTLGSRWSCAFHDRLKREITATAERLIGENKLTAKVAPLSLSHGLPEQLHPDCCQPDRESHSQRARRKDG